MIEQVAGFLRLKNWSSPLINRAIVTLNRNNLPIKAMDIAYCALLLNKISPNIFYDYVLYLVIQDSFSKTQNAESDIHSEEQSVYPLPKAKNIVWNNGVSNGNLIEEHHYIRGIINKARKSSTFQFNENLFFEELEKQNSAYYFTVTVDKKEFITAIEHTTHAEWTQLFLSPKYLLLRYDSVGDELRINIPSIGLLQAFLKAIVNNEQEVITPLMALGVVSADTSELMHKKGFHIISIQDKRFKSLTMLHGRQSNSFEVVMHDLLFHTITLSARSIRIRSLFWNSVVPLLKNYIAFESEHLCNLESIMQKATQFFYQHLLETALDVSMQVPHNKIQTVTSSGLFICLNMLLGSIRQTTHYFSKELTQEDIVPLFAQILERLFTYLKTVARLNVFMKLLDKYFPQIIVEVQHPAQDILIKVWGFLENYSEITSHKF